MKSQIKAKIRDKYKETDLFNPVKNFFENKGYNVHGEVKDCDIVASLEDELIVIELKTSFSLKLLYQGIERQKITDKVYLCIPRPKTIRSSNYKNMVTLVKRMNLGLITVGLDSPMKPIDIVYMPIEPSKPKNQKKRIALNKELAGRNVNINEGGLGKTKINTAFRERSIKIACILEKEVKISAKTLIHTFGCEKDAHSILYQNHYGWFCRVEKGIYSLSPEGLSFLKSKDFAEVVKFYRKFLQQ